MATKSSAELRADLNAIRDERGLPPIQPIDTRPRRSGQGKTTDQLLVSLNRSLRSEDEYLAIIEPTVRQKALHGATRGSDRFTWIIDPIDGTRYPCVPEVLCILAKVMEVPEQILIMTSREQHVCFARQTAMYVMREATEYSFSLIGKLFGLHHSTVIHNCNLIKRRIDSNSDFARGLAHFVDEFREYGMTHDSDSVRLQFLALLRPRA